MDGARKIKLGHVIQFEFRRYLWRQKTSPGAIVWHYLRDPTFSRFDTILECVRHTNIHNDTQRRYIPRYHSVMR